MTAMPKLAVIAIYCGLVSFERKADKQVNHLKDGNSDKADIST
jgi:hypothetical protein